MAKALIGFFGQIYHEAYIHNKSVSALTRYRGSRMPNQRISDVHAISADIHNYRYFDLFKKFARFLYLPNNC